MQPAAQHTALRAEVGRLFDRTRQLLANSTNLSDAVQHVEAASGSSDTDLHFARFRGALTKVRARLENQDLVVAVLALTKSGKSTLLNALIGVNCLPANNIPETARIVQITHTSDEPHLLDNSLGHGKVITGEQEIKAYLRYLNTEARTREHSQSDETLLDLQMPVAAFEQYLEEAAPGMAIRLLDTPGPNEAGEVALKAQVERLLDSVDAVIYVLDYTKLKTADEAEILRRLKEINPQLMSRLSQRLFFVVNKADMIETSEGMGAAATQQYVADLITQQIQVPDFQLKPDQVLLISAQHALLSRLVLQDKADSPTLARFARLAFGIRASKVSAADCSQAAAEMLQESGLAALEEKVLGFLYAHSGNVRLLALLDDVLRTLHQMRNMAAASNAALQHDVAALQQENEQMQARLLASMASFDQIQQDAQAVEGEVVDEVQHRMQRLKEKLFEDVSSALEVSPPAGPPRGRWGEAWLRASRFLLQRSGSGHRQQQELQHRLHELHAAISSSIEAEVQDFWQDVEAASNERQRHMFQLINQHLQALSQRIEDTVGRVLDVRLEPVTIAMDPPAAQDFHESLQSLFALGIQRRSERRTRERVQDYTVWEPRFRNGLCRTGQYFVGRPASRCVTEQYDHPIYDLQPQHIKDYFLALVDSTVEASVRYVREYVHAYLNDTLKEARGRIQEYADSFSQTMQAALATRQQGELAQGAALAAVKAQLDTIQTIIKDTHAVQRRVEASLPGCAEHAEDTELAQTDESAAAAANSNQDAVHAKPPDSLAGSDHTVVPIPEAAEATSSDSSIMSAVPATQTAEATSSDSSTRPAVPVASWNEPGSSRYAFVPGGAGAASILRPSAPLSTPMGQSSPPQLSLYEDFVNPIAAAGIDASAPLASTSASAATAAMAASNADQGSSEGNRAASIEDLRQDPSAEASEDSSNSSSSNSTSDSSSSNGDHQSADPRRGHDAWAGLHDQWGAQGRAWAEQGRAWAAHGRAMADEAVAAARQAQDWGHHWGRDWGDWGRDWACGRDWAHRGRARGHRRGRGAAQARAGVPRGHDWGFRRHDWAPPDHDWAPRNEPPSCTSDAHASASQAAAADTVNEAGPSCSSAAAAAAAAPASPLPAMMMELRDAMTASTSTAGEEAPAAQDQSGRPSSFGSSAAAEHTEAAQGTAPIAAINMEEQAQLELAIFLSLEEEKTRAASKAAFKAAASSSTGIKASSSSGTNLMDDDTLLATPTEAQQSALLPPPPVTAPRLAPCALSSPFADQQSSGVQPGSILSHTLEPSRSMNAAASSQAAGRSTETSNSSLVRSDGNGHEVDDDSASEAEQAKLTETHVGIPTWTGDLLPGIQHTHALPANSAHSDLSSPAVAGSTHDVAPEAEAGFSSLSLGAASHGNVADGMLAAAGPTVGSPASASDLSSAVRSPVHSRGASRSDAWSWLDDELPTHSSQLDVLQPGSGGAVAQGNASSAARTLLRLTSDDSIFGPGSTNTVPGLSQVNPQAENANQRGPQLQLQTEDSQFLQYCLDPAHGILPQEHPSVTAGPTPPAAASPSLTPGLRGSMDGQQDHGSDPAVTSLPVSLPARAVTRQDVFDSSGLFWDSAQPLSPRSQLHSTAHGGDLFYPAGEEADESAGSAEYFVEHGVAEPASIHADQEHGEAAELHESGEMRREDSSAWSLVGSDVDQHDHVFQ